MNDEVTGLVDRGHKTNGRVGAAGSRIRARGTGEWVEGNYWFQHRAPKGNLGFEIQVGGEIGVIKSCLSTYFVSRFQEIILSGRVPMGEV